MTREPTASESLIALAGIVGLIVTRERLCAATVILGFVVVAYMTAVLP